MSSLDVLARTLPSLLVIVGALLLLRRWAQRAPGRSGTELRVLTRTGLTKGAVVAVVAVADRRLLVGASERGVDLLAELDPETVPDPAQEAPVVAPSSAPRLAASTAFSSALSDVWRASRTRLSASPDPDRPRMAPIDRLRHLTVRRPVPSHPRRPTVVRRRT